MPGITNMTFTKNQMTTISISMKNGRELVCLGSKDMSFDEILGKVLRQHIVEKEE